MSTPLISVVDDDASVRVAIENLLKSRGYIVPTFASAEEFLQSMQLHEMSCVITDVQMSTMSGLDMLAATRARGYNAPFIFITAFPTTAFAPPRRVPERLVSRPSHSPGRR